MGRIRCCIVNRMGGYVCQIIVGAKQHGENGEL